MVMVSKLLGHAKLSTTENDTHMSALRMLQSYNAAHPHAHLENDRKPSQRKKKATSMNRCGLFGLKDGVEIGAARRENVDDACRKGGPINALPGQIDS
jgi:hypothetical protein